MRIGIRGCTWTVALAGAVLAVATLLTACEDESDAGTQPSTTIRPLTPWEEDVVGTWYYYSSSYSEYRCITLNDDRTACYFEVPSLSSTSKGNQKCYTDWYIDTVLTGSVYKLYVLGDNTGGAYWAGYQWNTSAGLLEAYDGVDRTRTSTIACDFCP